ncbi:MAG: uroporphyrinogen decarboxylase family protein [Kiritimatiellales bacterium]
MTSRERVERSINFEKPDRLPFNFWMDRRRMEELNRKYGEDFRVTRFDADVVEAMSGVPFPVGRFEEKAGTPWMIAPLFKDWNVTPDIKLPDPKDPALTANCVALLKRYPDKAVIANLPNVLTHVEAMISQADFYMDLIDEPELVGKFFHRMSDVMAALAERLCKLDITALYVMDDIACNHGLLMSPAQVREHILPHWKKVIDVAHAHGKPVFFHTDGKVDELYDVFADELKIRMLNPLQPDLQDVGEFARTYKSRTGIYGGLNTGRIHLMTPEQIRNHVAELFEKAGQGGGLIVSSHDLDISTTEEQLDALTGAIKECIYK